MNWFLEYDLPSDLIAQEPAERRDESRLMIIDRRSGRIEHTFFNHLAHYLAAGDTLVLNDTRVVPARLIGRRARTGGKWEGLFLREATDSGCWELLCQTRGRLERGEEILIESPEPPGMRLVLCNKMDSGHWIARPEEIGQGERSTADLLERYGKVPLPPYIRKGVAVPSDRERYQTVYAGSRGAVAAPTAGLHFTKELMAELDGLGIERSFITLHVGLGTFQLVKSADVRQHQMHSEWGELSALTAQKIRACRTRGKRVVAVGTTSVRVLETVAASGAIGPWHGDTELFIYPPYQFRATDALLTNFHLPKSTLLLLVGAFAGTELLREAYDTAMRMQYRFFSYGDAMLIF
jgi:S-adenosylmethionine:tRNA ribosyltransferase-isomerase